MRIKQVLLMAILLFMSAGTILAQTQTGTLTGVVTDDQGGVLPGATVTVTSPALIGGSRSTTAGQEGIYQFVALPPGIYSLTFEMSGFKRVAMEGIRVNVAFVSKVNARLQIAGVEETVTVVGESPVVDVKQTVSAINIDKELAEAVPSGRNPWAVAAMVPGMVTGQLDVGGNQGMQQYSLEIFGSNPDQKSFSIDGLKVNWPGGSGGATMQYYDFGMYEEYNFQSSGQSAEVDVAGVYMNMVTKSGGNSFSGDNVVYFENDALQTENLDDALRAKGVTAGNPIDISYDWNSTLGGPVVRDQVWFFGSVRWWRLDQFQIGARNPDGSQGIDDNRIRNFMGKGTWQASQKDKLSVMGQGNHKQRFHRRDPPYLFAEDRATRFQNQWAYNLLAQYYRILTDSTFLDVRIGRMWGATPYHYQEGVKPTDISIRDRVRGTIINAQFTDYVNPNHRYQYNATFNHFKDNLLGGYHDFKVGVQFSFERMFQQSRRNGDYLLQYADGVPERAVLSNSPTDEEELTRTWAVYLQDNWTIRQRLTVNLGVRFDGINGIIPEQSSAAGTWVGARQFQRQEGVPNWRSVAPRLGFAYDLFGNGKTAIKGGYGRYYDQIGTLIAETLNPNAFSDVQATWRDLDGNGALTPGRSGTVVDSPELGPIPAFPVRRTKFDEDSSRPYGEEMSLGFHHTITANTGIEISYHRRQFRNGLGLRDQARPTSVYTPQTRTYTLPDGTSNTITVYNLPAPLLAVVDRVITNVDLLQSNYNGVSINFTKKYSNRWQLLAGVTFSDHNGFLHSGTFTNADFNDPNVVIGREGAAVFNDIPVSFRLGGSYLFPQDVELAVRYGGSSGGPLQRLLAVTGLSQAETVHAAPRGTDRLESLTDFVDLRLAKKFKVGSGVLEGSIDFFNLLNSNTVLAQVETIGSRLGQPQTIVAPRIIRLGVQFSF